MRKLICLFSALALSLAAAGAERRPVVPKAYQASTVSILPPAEGTSSNAAGLKSDIEAADNASLALFKPVAKVASQWLQRPELQKSVVGLEIMDVPSGRVLFSQNGRKRLVTASTAKVLTTACAFDVLGADYKYKTGMLAYGDLHGGHLSGPLVVAASQDPSITSDDMRQLVAAVAGRLKTVGGHVFVAPVAGGGDHFNTEWLVQDWAQDWMPVSSDLIIDRNVVSAKDPGRGYPVVTINAEADTNALVQGLLRSPWAPGWVQFNRASNTVLYYRPDQAISGALVVADPIDFNTAYTRWLLKSAGVKVEGHDLPASGEPLLLAEHYSKPLANLIRFTLKESDNLYAQQLLRTVGQTPVTDKRLENATLEDRGLARLNSWLLQIGVPAGEVVIWDGCGLSRKNAITPHALNTVLRHMVGSSGAGTYIDLMTHDGEGSARTWRYKTGAMDSVRSITGIVKTSAGHPLAMTAIINDHTPSVRELRTSLAALVGSLESLGALRFSPVVEKQSQPSSANVHSRPARRLKHRGRRH